MDWTVISNDETARQFGDHILEAPRAFDRNGTSISAGIDFAVTQLDGHPTTRAAVSSTFQGMAITIAAVMSLRRETRLSLKASRSTVSSS